MRTTRAIRLATGADKRRLNPTILYSYTIFHLTTCQDLSISNKNNHNRPSSEENPTKSIVNLTIILCVIWLCFVFFFESLCLGLVSYWFFLSFFFLYKQFMLNYDIVLCSTYMRICKCICVSATNHMLNLIHLNSWNWKTKEKKNEKILRLHAMVILFHIDSALTEVQFKWNRNKTSKWRARIENEKASGQRTVL